MGQTFCIFCGAALTDDANFCVNCGEPVEQDVIKPGVEKPGVEKPGVEKPGVVKPDVVEQDALVFTDIPEVILGVSHGAPEDTPVSVTAATEFPVKIIAGILIVLVIAAVMVFIVLPKLSGSTGLMTSQKSTESVTTIPQAFTTTDVSTPIANPFPNALALRQKLLFGSGDGISEGTVYRYWMNDTYRWHNDNDNHYYVEKPAAGYKFLAIFVDVVNKGSTRVWPPTPGNIHLIYDGKEYALDPDHYQQDKSVKIVPIEIQEIQYISKFSGIEYVEDYGYSHGTTLSYLFPGASNAIDGYLIYEVPESLTPDKTFVKIEFNWKDVGIWKLA